MPPVLPRLRQDPILKQWRNADRRFPSCAPSASWLLTGEPPHVPDCGLRFCESHVGFAQGRLPVRMPPRVVSIHCFSFPNRINLHRLESGFVQENLSEVSRSRFVSWTPLLPVARLRKDLSALSEPALDRGPQESEFTCRLFYLSPVNRALDWAVVDSPSLCRVIVIIYGYQRSRQELLIEPA